MKLIRFIRTSLENNHIETKKWSERKNSKRFPSFRKNINTLRELLEKLSGNDVVSMLKGILKIHYSWNSLFNIG